ncbi:Integrase (XerC) [uncultured Mediterranean phage uvMED]|nr:Integrase (XerC) [uncultured Mediterranean phage uvMED]
MPQKQKDWFPDKRNRMVGRFPMFKTSKGYSLERDLCTIEDANFYSTKKGKRKRTDEQYHRYMNMLWQEKYKALLEDRNAHKEVKLTEAEKHSLSEAIIRYEKFEVNLLKPRSQIEIKRHLRYWDMHLGYLPLSEITPARLAEQKDALSSHVITHEGRGKGSTRSPATINRYFAALGAVMTCCVEKWYWLDVSPTRLVPNNPEPKGRTRFLSEDEIHRLLDVVKDNKALELAIVLALSTGARQAEIWGLKWSQVNVKTGNLTFTVTKNGDTRSVTVGRHVRILLKHFRRNLDTPYVFPSKIKSKRLTKSFDFKQPFQEALKKAEIVDFCWHDLRHTAASYLAMNGATLREIADILGHKSLDMVMRYTHLTKEHTAEVIKKMNDKMFAS